MNCYAYIPTTRFTCLEGSHTFINDAYNCACGLRTRDELWSCRSVYQPIKSTVEQKDAGKRKPPEHLYAPYQAPKPALFFPSTSTPPTPPQDQ